MKLGMPLREYERQIPPANRMFHEAAERLVLHKEGVLPLDPEDAEESGPGWNASAGTGTGTGAGGGAPTPGADAFDQSAPGKKKIRRSRR